MTLTNIQKEMIETIRPNRIDYKLELLNKQHNLNSSLNMFMLNQRFFENKCDDEDDDEYNLFEDIIYLFKQIKDCIENLLKTKIFDDCDIDDNRNCYTYNIPVNINNDFEYANYIKKSITEQIENIDKGCITHILILYNKMELIQDTKEKLINKLLELEFKDITKTNAYFTPDE